MSKLYKKICQPNVAQTIFWIGFFIELAIVSVNMGDFSLPFEEKWYWIACIFFFAKIVLTNFTKKERYIVIFFIGLAMVNLFLTRDIFFMGVVTMILAAKDISRDKAIKYLFIVMFITFIVLALLSATGIFGVLKRVEDYGRGGIETRYCFGEKHPNNLHATIWLLTLLSFYIYFKQLKWYHFALAGIINVIAFSLTASRTGTIITFLVIGLTCLMKYGTRVRDKKTLYIFGYVTLFACLLFSLLVGIYGHNIPILGELDKKLTGRIYWAYEAAHNNNLLFFAGKDNWVNIDMAYIKMFYSYGIIFGGLYIFSNIMLIMNAKKTKNYMVFVVLITLICVSLVESHAVVIYIGRDLVFLLMFGTWNQLFQKNGAYNKSESIKS